MDGDEEAPGEQPPAESVVVPTALAALREELERLSRSPKLSRRDILGQATHLSFDLPAGRGNRKVVVDEVSAAALVAGDIANWRSLERYDGVWNPSQGIVEVAIRGERFGYAPTQHLRRIVQATASGTSSDTDKLAVELTDGTGVSIQLGEPSEEIAALLTGHRPGLRTPVTMRILPVAVATTEAADGLVERITDALALDLSIGFGISIFPQRLESRAALRGAVVRRQGRLAFPKNTYPHAPMALYQAGRDRVSSPLMRYWSFYQVLEYFFPRFSQQEAVKQLSRLLRSPVFDPHDDEDVLRAVQLSTAAGKGYGSEEEQLHTTLKAVVSSREVIEFIEASGLTEQMQDKSSELTKKPMRQSGNDDVLLPLAQRIYDIRCRIVHSKSASARDAGPGLLPGTHHDDLVRHELRLMEFLAQQALLAAADRLVIPKA